MVLDLDQGHHVRIDRRQRRDDLTPLPCELLGRVRAAAFLVPCGTADVGPRVDRRKVVEHVEGGNPKRALNRQRRPRPGVGGGIQSRCGGLDPIGPVAIVHSAGNAGQRIAAAEEVAQVKDCAIGVDRRIGIPDGPPVVQRDAIPRDEVYQSERLRRAGLVGRRRLAQAFRGQHDLTVAIIVKVLGDHQRLREGNQHPLVGLELVQVCHWQRKRRRRHTVAAGADPDLARGYLGHPVVLGDRAADADGVACSHVDPARGVDKDPVRGHRLGIADGVLHVKAVQIAIIQRGIVLEIAHDDTLQCDLSAGQRTGGAIALDHIDRREQVAAGLSERGIVRASRERRRSGSRQQGQRCGYQGR